MFRRLILATVLLAALAGVSHAQGEPKSLLSLDRFAVSGGANYDWHAGEDLTPSPQFKNEFVPGVYGAYVLTEHSSASLPVVYGAGNRLFRVSPGVHLRFGGISESIALGIAYDFYVGDSRNMPSFPREWSVSAIYARPLTKQVVIGVSETYGMDNREWRTSVGFRFIAWTGKDS